ncbi:MAG: PilZ domain-containing protein [Myxococcota bacterium]
MSAATLQVRFESPEALREEFEKNIANRGVFVPTEQPFESRQRVRVEILLTYVSEVEIAHAMTGEVVHCIPKEMASSGATPGVAIQFDATASQLVQEFEPLLGQLPAETLTKDTEGPARRGAKRGAIRVPVRIMPTMSPPFEATSRDLSASGILLSIRENPLPVGEVVRVCLWHPSGDPSVEIDGRVVREVKNKRGEIAAAAVAFNEYQAREPAIREVIDALRQVGHHNQLGGISGSLSDLGLANMLQMFGCSAPQGTLVVEHEGEQGWIAFQDERFLAAELGSNLGRDAVVEMLQWGDGQFRFEASVDASLTLAEDSPPLMGLVMDAVCAIDELGQASDDEEEEEAVVGADVSEELMVDLNEELAKEVVPGNLAGSEIGADLGHETGTPEAAAEIDVEFDFTDEDLAEIEMDPDGDLEIDLSPDLSDGLGAELGSEASDVDETDAGEAATEFLAELGGDGEAERTQVLAMPEEGASLSAGLDSEGLDVEMELEIVGETTFMVDVEQEEAWGPELQKMDEAVIELSKAGMSLARLESIIPEPAESVRAAVVGLIEMGVLFPRP